MLSTCRFLSTKGCRRAAEHPGKRYGEYMVDSNHSGEERILLVDDNPLNLQVLMETLQSRQSRPM